MAFFLPPKENILIVGGAAGGLFLFWNFLIVLNKETAFFQFSTLKGSILLLLFPSPFLFLFPAFLLFQGQNGKGGGRER